MKYVEVLDRVSTGQLTAPLAYFYIRRWLSIAVVFRVIYGTLILTQTLTLFLTLTLGL